MNELKRLDLNLMVTLSALLVEKHVTRAAASLGRSQPAVSHSLRQLRERFDDPLLVRRNGKMILTTRAEQLKEPLEDALSRLDALLRAPRFDPAEATTRFRLTFSDYAAQVILPGLVRIVRKAAPGIDLVIGQGSREAMIANLLDGEIDLALGIFPEHPNGILVSELFRERFVSVADMSAVPKGIDLSLTDWLERPHVLVALKPDTVDEIDLALAELGERRRIALSLPYWGAALDVVPGTDLILTVASRTVGDMPRHGTLRVFEPPTELPRLPYQQAWHVRREADPAHRWLRQMIARTCSSH